MDESKWIIEYERDNGPRTYYLYTRETGDLDYLLSDRPDLEGFELASMHSAIVRSRDGLDIIVYYTLPVGSTQPSTVRLNRCRRRCSSTEDHGAGTAGDTTPNTSFWQTAAMRS